MSIITKQGDAGRTKLLTGEEVSKTDPRLEAAGALDELTSHLGFARALLRRTQGDEATARAIEELQRDLIRMGGELSSRGAANWVESTTEAHVRLIEEKVSEIEGAIALPREFVLPGATEAGAALDIARTVARRLERCVVALHETGGYVNRQGLIYLNRLSDYLFMLARKVELAAHKETPDE
jgi:cob(I)alamin adenosyltransferase